jgi:uncharacterized protein YggE
MTYDGGTMRLSRYATIGMAAVLATACTIGDGQPEINVTTGDEMTGISVSGTGEVTGTPDTVTVDFGVNVLGATVAEASSKAAAAAEAVIGVFTGHDIERGDITTTNYSIWPEYDWRDNSQRLVGYRVNNTVRVKIREVASTGDVLDAAIAAGGDVVTVSGLSFSIDDDSELVKQAREAAWQDALAKAQQLAVLSGQTLGRAISINETVTGYQPPIVYEALARDEGGAAKTPIEPGSSSVTISLQIQFAFEG